MKRASIILVAAATSRLASADPFVLLDRVDSERRAGAEVSDTLRGDVQQTTMQLNLHGHYATASGVGGYGQLGLAYIDATRSSFAVGKLDAGAFYTRAATENIEVVVRAGLALPTASETNNNPGTLRLQDNGVLGPGHAFARTGVSTLYRNGALIARLDLGFDFQIAGPARWASVVHGGGGVGVAIGHDATVSLEVMTVKTFRFGEEFDSAAALSVRLESNRWRPYAAFAFPIDYGTRKATDVMAVIGLETTL